jgi:hypothetical protein
LRGACATVERRRLYDRRQAIREGTRELAAAHSGCDEHERRHYLGVLESEIDGDRSAARDADQRSAIDVQEAQQRVQIFDVGIRCARRRRFAEAANVVANDAVLAGERGELVVPDTAVEPGPVDEDDGRSGAARLIVQRPVLDRRHSRRQRRVSLFRACRQHENCQQGQAPQHRSDVQPQIGADKPRIDPGDWFVVEGAAPSAPGWGAMGGSDCRPSVSPHSHRPPGADRAAPSTGTEPTRVHLR